MRTDLIGSRCNVTYTPMGSPEREFVDEALKFHEDLLEQALSEKVLDKNSSDYYKLCNKGNKGYVWYKVDKLNSDKKGNHFGLEGFFYTHSSIGDVHPLSHYPFVVLQQPEHEARKLPKPFQVNKKKCAGVGTVDRKRDTEGKLLEKLAEIFIENSTSGEVKLFTYREPCFSCEYQILEFMHRYPDVRLHIFYIKSYNIV